MGDGNRRIANEACRLGRPPAVLGHRGRIRADSGKPGLLHVKVIARSSQ